MIKYSAARWLECQDLAALGVAGHLPELSHQPLVTTLETGYFRRKEDVSSKPHSVGSGFGLSEQRPPQLEAPLSERLLTG